MQSHRCLSNNDQDEAQINYEAMEQRSSREAIRVCVALRVNHNNLPSTGHGLTSFGYAHDARVSSHQVHPLNNFLDEKDLETRPPTTDRLAYLNTRRASDTQ
jgi:hypothetical protein